jgi:hypothetical protein
MTHHPQASDEAELDIAEKAESVLSAKKVQQLSVKPTRIVESDIRLKKDIETA